MVDNRNLTTLLDESEKKKLAHLERGNSSDYAQIQLILHYMARYNLKKHHQAITEWLEDKLRYTVAEGGKRADQLVTAIQSERNQIQPQRVGEPMVVVQTNGSGQKPSQPGGGTLWDKMKRARL